MHLCCDRSKKILRNTNVTQKNYYKRNLLHLKKIEQKENLFAFVGTIISFTINFNPSANGWSNPQTPTILGPKRRWIAAIPFRSANVKNAIAINNGIRVKPV